MVNAKKTCFKCGQELPLTEFYRHAQMKDGHLNKCKTCAKRDVRENYRADPEARRAYERKREQRPERKAKKAEYQRRFRARHQDRSEAHNAVSNALRDGKLVQGPCLDCGTTEQVEAHHPDYRFPLAVEWLCFACHRGRHGQLVEGS